MFGSSYFKLALLSFLSLLGLVVAAVVQCAASQRMAEPCLGYLEPFVDQLFAWSAFPRYMRWVYFKKLLGSIGVVIGCIGLLSFVTRRPRSGLLSVALLCAMVGETLVLMSYPNWLSLSATAVATFVIALSMGRLPASSAHEVATVEPPRMWEALAFIPFAIVFTLIHFYVLNRIPGNWDTEGCVFRFAFHQSFHGVMMHEAGMHPLTSLGMVWNVLHWLMGRIDEPDLYYLFTRFLSTGVAAVKFLVIFLLLRRISGPFPAFLGMAILGFGPPEDWWSREPGMHQLPGLLALLILWAAIRAYEHRRYRDFFLLALLDASTRLVYPSGMFFGFAPLTFFGLLIIFRWHEWKRHIPKVVILFAGVAFWVSWRTVAHGLMTGYWAWQAPFEVPSHAMLPTSLFVKFRTIFFDHGLDAATTIFAQQVNPSHWTWPLTWGVSRSTTSIVVILIVVAFARILRGRSGAIGLLLLISVGWSLVPGLVTAVADRRIGAVFAILIVMAAREAGYILSVLEADGWRRLSRVIKVGLPPVVAMYLAWISSTMHFEHKGDTPPQVVRGQLFRQFIEDDALVFYVTSDGNCDVFSSLYQDIKSRNCKTGWTTSTYSSSPELPALIEKPEISRVMWPYRQTDLAQCLEQHQKPWNKIIFLFADNNGTRSFIEQVRSQHPGGVLETRSQTLETGFVVKVFAYKVDKQVGGT
jgi:hypothetical protein